MQIKYEEPVNAENIGLLATIAIIIFGGIIAVNFSSISDSAAETTITNLAFIPALLLMVVLFAIGHFNSLKSKKSLDQIISEYNSFAKLHFDDEKFKGFYINDKKLSIGNYKSLREMPKNIASYFVGEETDARR
jgi:hypothetical protein